jgi:hypothetical protein
MSLFAILVAAVMATATPHASMMHSTHNRMMSHSHMKSHSATHSSAMHSKKKTAHHGMMSSTPKPR